MDKNGFYKGGYPISKPISKDCGYLTPNQRLPFGSFEQMSHVPKVIHDLNWIGARHHDSVWIAADLIAVVMLIFALSPLF